jgi:hypothetical protein
MRWVKEHESQFPTYQINIRTGEAPPMHVVGGHNPSSWVKQATDGDAVKYEELLKHIIDLKGRFC